MSSVSCRDCARAGDQTAGPATVLAAAAPVDLMKVRRSMESLRRNSFKSHANFALGVRSTRGRDKDRTSDPYDVKVRHRGPETALGALKVLIFLRRTGTDFSRISGKIQLWRSLGSCLKI